MGNVFFPNHTYHFNADYNFFVYPDQAYRRLLNRRANFLVEGEFSQSEAGRIEVEWERSGAFAPSPYGFPEWAWPTVGDRVDLLGWHILDCGHGNPNFCSEIHPPLVVATYRNAALSPFAGASGRLGSYHPVTRLPATRVDLFASSYGGTAYGIETGQTGQWFQPLASQVYQFDVLAPPKPSPNATLAPPKIGCVPRGASDGPCIDVGQATLTPTPLPYGNGYHFTLKFAQKFAAYGATIWVSWNDPAKPTPSVVTYKVTPVAIHVYSNLTGKWGLYAYVNEQAAGSILEGDGTTSLHENYRRVENRHSYFVRNRSFVVTLVKGQPLHIEFRVTSFERSATARAFTQFGTSDFAGTAAITYTNPSDRFPRSAQKTTVEGARLSRCRGWESWPLQ